MPWLGLGADPAAPANVRKVRQEWNQELVEHQKATEKELEMLRLRHLQDLEEAKNAGAGEDVLARLRREHEAQEGEGHPRLRLRFCAPSRDATIQTPSLPRRWASTHGGKFPQVSGNFFSAGCGCDFRNFREKIFFYKRRVTF